MNDAVNSVDKEKSGHSEPGLRKSGQPRLVDDDVVIDDDSDDFEALHDSPMHATKLHDSDCHHPISKSSQAELEDHVAL